MTKGSSHPFGSSRFQERYLRTYSCVQDQYQGQQDDDLAELVEEEVWSVPEHDHHFSSEVPTMDQYQVGAQSNYSSSQPAAWPAKVRRQAVGGLSLAFADAGNLPQTTSQSRGHDCGKKSGSETGLRTSAPGSAPINMPSWATMMRTDSTELPREEYDSAEEVDVGERIPPHEYLSRSRRTAATSVFEGAGRTLKGRDMSRVRDAVWNQTGFFG